MDSPSCCHCGLELLALSLGAIDLLVFVLMVLDPSTFRGSPRYEVPTIPHTIWCRSLIWYDGPVAIILDIFLSSCCSTHDSVMLVTSRKQGEYAW